MAESAARGTAPDNIPGVPAKLQTLAAVLLRLARNPLASEFRQAVADLHPECAGKYLREIARPMDIGKLNRYLRRGRYLHGRERQFYDDTLLMFRNCRQFNVRSPVLHALSDHLTTFFDDMWYEWVLPQVTAGAAATAAPGNDADRSPASAENAAGCFSAAQWAESEKQQRRADRTALVSQVWCHGVWSNGLFLFWVLVSSTFLLV